MEEFLKQCQQSGDAAYAAFRSLLERLEDPKTRVQARIFLSDLHKHVTDSISASRSTISGSKIYSWNNMKNGCLLVALTPSLPSAGYKGRKKLTMMDKTVAELGCGNGWISIAIAEKWLPSKVYGLDINPRAVRDHDIQLERIVGCIPQILNPNPDAMSKMITENASEEFLYSLSNYCALQGFVEDQFGLGLIARAVEEGISVIKPMGIMIFNMGGRPGQAVCKRLFERRGFRVDKLWQTKVIQAADTDISALVEIEKNSPHRFEFFMGLSGDQPICARTAWAYGKAGGRIAHALSVYSCQLRHPNHDGFHEVSSSLDLSFEDDSVADEKIPFLAYLSGELKESSSFPYESPAGSKRFRNLIADFMKIYHHIPLSSNNVVIFPSRAVAIENALRLFPPHLAIVDEHLTRHLPRQWLTSLAIEHLEYSKLQKISYDNFGRGKSDIFIPPWLLVSGFMFGADNEASLLLILSGPSVVRMPGSRQGKFVIMELLGEMRHGCNYVIEAPRQSDLMVELIKKLKPQVVITGMAQFEAVTSSAFVQLLDITREIGSRLFLDISDQLELSSLPSPNGVLNILRNSATFACCNPLWPCKEPEEEAIFRALSKTVEVLEGNTAPIRQFYYGCLFHELLAFQLADRHPLAERECEKAKSVDAIGFASSAIVLNDSELSIETDVTPSIKQFIKSNYGFPSNNSTEFIYTDFSQALFNRLILCCIQEGGTFCFPAGSNGNYVSAAKFLKANIMSIPTDSGSGFKLTDKLLNGVLETVNKPWVYIAGPTINPSGLLYSNKEMENLLTTCAKFGARVVIDTSFSGLEFDLEGWGGWNLEATLSKLNSSGNPLFSVSLLGGLSLRILSGVLKFGFLVLNHPSLVNAFYSFPGLSKPHSTVKYAIKKLLGLNEQKADLTIAVAEQSKKLKSRSQRMKETLEKCGWEVLQPCGGVSMMAKPSAYLNKVVKIKHSPDDDVKNATAYEVKLGDSNIREAIVKSTGLCINSGLWTGIPGYCRFTFALEESDFERALNCIAKFKDLLNN
ncbi:hypothetical protein GH714_007187 [Hevea brasiliensis]|uniref:methionine S-methyltransferase n=1 Tax=Hevea brasiliensis TaxID=3981 RepID=A0A6A6KYD6_HEVBR|nr:hypothetical protein GH714_007187 [Hevea brasiliensis]